MSMTASLHTLQLRVPFKIAHGTSDTRQVLRLQEGGHITEAPFVPYYAEDPAETLRLVSMPVLPPRLPRAAALAFNLLRHDIVCTAQGVPLRAMAAARLGEEGRVPPACHSLGIPDDLGVFEETVGRLARQFRVLKLKLGGGDLGLDIATVSVARMAAPEAALILDVNGGWDPVQAAPMIDKLAGYEPALIEQPIHHRHGMAGWENLRADLKASAPPIYADESAQSAADVAELAGYADGVNVKLLKCGGFDGAVAMIEAARAEGLGVLLGCMIESSLGTTAAAHLAPWADWIDLDGHLHVLNDDFDGLRFSGTGELCMPERPGIGAVPREGL
jgi:L-alanine-DL-glutamate epimerase-like enolase superfamily enzyme